MPNSLLLLVLVLNAIWFAMGFYAFYIRRRVFAKVVVPKKDDRDNTAYEAVIESGRFMGGFNFALSALNIMLLVNFDGFDKDSQWATLLILTPWLTARNLSAISLWRLRTAEGKVYGMYSKV